jgi:hypothetical protein
MPTSWMMPNQFCSKMSKRQLLTHEQKLHCNGIAWRKHHKGMKRSLNHLLSSLLQKSFWRFWAFLIKVWDTYFNMHFHELKRMKNLVSPSSNASYLVWERWSWHGMPPYGNENLASPFKLKNATNPWFACIRDHSRMVFIFKPFHYSKFNCSIKILKKIQQIVVTWNYRGPFSG